MYRCTDRDWWGKGGIISSNAMCVHGGGGGGIIGIVMLWGEGGYYTVGNNAMYK